MNIRQAIGSVLQTFVVLTFFGASLFFFFLPSYPHLRFALSQILIDRPDLCIQIALCLLATAFLFFFGFYWINRGYYLVLQMGKNSLAIDEKVLWQTLEPILERKFASRLNLNQVSIERGKRLSFGLEIPPMSEEEKELLLLEAESELEMLLRERFGYRRPFIVQVSTRSS